MDDTGFHVSVGQFLNGIHRRFNAALDVGFENQHQFLDIAGVDLLHDVVEGKDGVQIARAAALAVPRRGLAGGALVGYHSQNIAGFRRCVEARDHARRTGSDRVHGFTAFVGDGPHSSPRAAGHDVVAHPQGSGLDQHGRGRPPAAVKGGFDNHAGSVSLGVRPQFQDFGEHQQVLDQVVNAVAGLGRYWNGDDVATPFFHQQVALAELPLDDVRLGGGQVHLVDCDDDGHLGRPGVVDGLVRLGHDAIVGGDDQHGNVGYPRASGPDRREGGVPGGIQESNRLSVL